METLEAGASTAAPVATLLGSLPVEPSTRAAVVARVAQRYQEREAGKRYAILLLFPVCDFFPHV